MKDDIYTYLPIRTNKTKRKNLAWLSLLKVVSKFLYIFSKPRGRQDPKAAPGRQSSAAESLFIVQAGTQQHLQGTREQQSDKD